ncbi:MAG TPA: S1/P1 nuclease [Caulobacteraceae bacterium]|nr:S1/P1 nuclease [Caulobacteraceae bacterium]
MPKAFLLVLAACLGTSLALGPTPAMAWDTEGHRIIAHLAYERLTPNAKAEIAELVKHSVEQGTPSCPVASLEDASAWPDCIRPLHGRFEYLALMHYEDVPICGVAPKATYCPDGKCITDETKRAIAILRDRQRPAVERLQALEEITHFIGDLHQPLHAANNNDRGGNDVKVMVEGHASNLHHVWDTEILENAVGTSEEAAEASLRPLVAANAARWSSGDVDSWLAQTHQLALSYVYPKLSSPPACGQPAPAQTISQTYLDDAAPLVRVQLARAAVRLAVILNRTLN